MWVLKTTEARHACPWMPHSTRNPGRRTAVWCSLQVRVFSILHDWRSPRLSAHSLIPDTIAWWSTRSNLHLPALLPFDLSIFPGIWCNDGNRQEQSHRWLLSPACLFYLKKEQISSQWNRNGVETESSGPFVCYTILYPVSAQLSLPANRQTEIFDKRVFAWRPEHI